MNKSTEKSDAGYREVRLERLRPRQIGKAIAEKPVIYVACGAIEWHGRQNPVGLDTIKAHEQLMMLARRVGGLVYPPIYFGAGGGHTGYPHTYMVDSQSMSLLLADMLAGFERDGFKAVVLLSGHYPNKREYFERAEELYRQSGGMMRIISLVENEVDGVGGDHAALYETSYLLHLAPDLVDLEELAGHDEDISGNDERRNWMDDSYADHPCYGQVGIDPRQRASAEIGKVNTDRLLEYLERHLAETE